MDVLDLNGKKSIFGFIITVVLIFVFVISISSYFLINSKREANLEKFNVWNCLKDTDTLMSSNKYGDNVTKNFMQANYLIRNGVKMQITKDICN